MADNGEQQSSLKQFLASIATIRGDLSNITAPPFVLADKSTTQFPRYWIEHPDLFVAPARESDPAKRILGVLKWFLASLKAQQYAGRQPHDGVKKPLNAFLGELYLGEIIREGDDVTKIVSEQVSHHPPVTACYLWNDKHGVSAEGYTRQEITFTGSVNIQQIGHAVMHLDEYDEDYLIPLPDVKVKGILTGSPYPELNGQYTIVSSSGHTAVVDFSGKGMLGIGGEKNHVVASVYQSGNGKPLFTVAGCWTESFIFKNAKGDKIDTYDVNTAATAGCKTLPVEDQDPWESQRAWKDVVDGIHAGNMQAVSDSKSKLENAQREMRKRSGLTEEEWTPIFFDRSEEHPIAQRLHDSIGKHFDVEGTCGIWTFNHDKAASLRRPWRGELTPSG